MRDAGFYTIWDMCTFKVTVLEPRKPRIQWYGWESSHGSKTAWASSYTSSPKYVFIAGCLVKDRKKFNFILTSHNHPFGKTEENNGHLVEM
jgi:hypothetical protein